MVTANLKENHAANDDDDDAVVDEANAYVEGSVFSSQSGPVPWKILEAVPRDPGSGDDDLTRNNPAIHHDATRRAIA